MPTQEQPDDTQREFTVNCENSKFYPATLVYKPQLHQLNRREDHVQYLRDNRDRLFSSRDSGIRLLQSKVIEFDGELLRYMVFEEI